MSEELSNCPDLEKIVLLPKEKAREAVEISCLHKACKMRYKPNLIYHMVAGIIIRLEFFT